MERCPMRMSLSLSQSTFCSPPFQFFLPPVRHTAVQPGNAGTFAGCLGSTSVVAWTLGNQELCYQLSSELPEPQSFIRATTAAHTAPDNVDNVSFACWCSMSHILPLSIFLFHCHSHWIPTSVRPTLVTEWAEVLQLSSLEHSKKLWPYQRGEGATDCVCY